MPRNIISLNRDWLYTPSFNSEFINANCSETDFEPVMLPHMNKEIPYNYFDETMYQFVSCYRKHFTVDSLNEHQQLYIDFEGVMTYADVYINGKHIGDHKGGYTEFSFNITDVVNVGQDNVLTVMVDSTERADIPPFGYAIDYLTYGGIYREVNLRIVDSLFVNNAFSQARDVLCSSPSLSTKVFLTNLAKQPTTATVSLDLLDGNTPLATTETTVSLTTETSLSTSLDLTNLSNIELWDTKNPKLYTVSIKVTTDTTADVYTYQYGFRHAEFTTNGFFLNGERMVIRGLNRHQAYPHVGYAMPWRIQKKDADILKYDLSLNLVRTSHYPQSRHFLDRCDEIGLLVFEEIPGWQHIGDEAWKEVAYENVREMITRDWNRPSIILWGVRINESADDHDFYTNTNAIAHELDPTRQTGGVRYVPKSELLEDVYTMNDFIQGQPAEVRALRPQQEVTELDHLVPYLVTEYNGHMFPTKRFDQEERLNEHALRHANVLNAAAADPHKSGCIGWCAFDYNTHYDFGSGDRICYHGVMDMFRIPKFASYAYTSQVSPSEKVVLEPVTLFTRGERSIGGIAPMTIFTNCDYIRMYEDGEFVNDYYPDRETYGSLEYPPVIIRKLKGEWGMLWHSAEFIGYIDGKEVIRKSYVKNPLYAGLSVVADDTTLCSGDMDATRIEIKAIDQADHIIPFAEDVIDITIDGPARLVGPSTFSLIGGCRGVWIQTTGAAGMITVTVTSQRLGTQTLTITVE